MWRPTLGWTHFYICSLAGVPPKTKQPAAKRRVGEQGQEATSGIVQSIETYRLGIASCNTLEHCMRKTSNRPILEHCMDIMKPILEHCMSKALRRCMQELSPDIHHTTPMIRVHALSNRCCQPQHNKHCMTKTGNRPIQTAWISWSRLQARKPIAEDVLVLFSSVTTKRTRVRSSQWAHAGDCVV